MTIEGLDGVDGASRPPGADPSLPGARAPTPTNHTATSLGSILDLLGAEDPTQVELLAGSLDRQVTEVRLIEDIGQLDHAGPETLVLLDRSLSRLADTYRLDIIVRRAIRRPIAGLALLLPAGARVSVTGLALCRKGDLPLIRLSSGGDVTDVLTLMARQVAESLHLTVTRARRACEAIDDLATSDVPVEEIIALGTRLLRREVILGPLPAGGTADLLAVPAVVTTSEGRWIYTTRSEDPDVDALVEMVLWRIAVEVSRRQLERERSQRVARQSAGELLLQLVDAGKTNDAELGRAAHQLGIPINGWHVVTRMELDNILRVSPVASPFEIRDRLADIAMTIASDVPGTWHVAQDPSTIMLLWSATQPPPADIGVRIQRQMRMALHEISRAVPELICYCGIGSVRASGPGLAASATEARLSVASARSRRRTNAPVSFDAIGMRATLVEWYGSLAVQHAIDALFAPLSDLTEANRNAVIDTVGVYLDTMGSISQTAERMHMHRNSIKYRISKAFELLGIDPDDADQRLFLHLACRAARAQRPDAAAS